MCDFIGFVRKLRFVIKNSPKCHHYIIVINSADPDIVQIRVAPQLTYFNSFIYLFILFQVTEVHRHTHNTYTYRKKEHTQRDREKVTIVGFCLLVPVPAKKHTNYTVLLTILFISLVG